MDRYVEKDVAAAPKEGTQGTKQERKMGKSSCTLRRPFSLFFPQIAIAIGVLTSNKGEADEPLWRIGRGTRVPLQGAIVVCYGWGAEGDDQFWWSGRGAIAGWHCSVL